MEMLIRYGFSIVDWVWVGTRTASSRTIKSPTKHKNGVRQSHKWCWRVNSIDGSSEAMYLHTL